MGSFSREECLEMQVEDLEKKLTEAQEEIVMLKAAKRFVCDSRPNLLHLGWAQGNYSNKCRHCETIFTGDKRAGCCADCAWKMESERAEKAEDDLSYEKNLRATAERQRVSYGNCFEEKVLLEAENKRLLELCENFFSHENASSQPYAGARLECQYCGATYNILGQADHSVADCPVMHLQAIKEKDKCLKSTVEQM